MSTPADPAPDAPGAAAAETGRTSVTQRAIERIKAMIAEGALRPGQRLPTERELSAELGLSRSSMREAIRALTTLGVLEARHGAGVYVTALRPADLLETFGVLAEISRGETLVEVLQVRRMLEPAATALAAARVDDERLARIGALLADLTDGGSLERAVAADLAFHQAIVETTGNATLAAVNAGLSSHTFRSRVWRGHQRAGLTGRLREDHERIYRALAARDPAAAQAAATVHVLEVENWLRAHLDDFA
ncbi:FadR/GntR family transcriptional regulator [Marinitenerispora sediminis]|nr:FCD domain-containing protein [Marinitenerispora sediminis]